MTVALSVAVAVLGYSAPATAGVDPPYLVEDINPAGDSAPTQMTGVGGILYFSAVGPGGRELWRSDGTVDGTFRVKNIRPGTASSRPKVLTDVGGVLYFVADDGTSGRELWKSNGTTAGTQRVKNIMPGSGWSRPRDLTNVGGQLFFTADDGSHGRELWVSDGSPSGTKMVRDFGPNSHFSAFTSFSGKLFFGVASCGPSLCDPLLWVSDGTPAGTEQVFQGNGSPILAVSEHECPANDHDCDTLVKAGSLLYGSYYQDLWVTDGICPSVGDCLTAYVNLGDVHPGAMENMGGELFFRGWVPSPSLPGEAGLWTSDGTPGGTELVKEVGVAGNTPRDITSVGTRLFFTIDFGAELWTSDGSTGGTEPLIDDVIDPGVRELTKVGGSLFFTVPDALWSSDGTVPGTQPIIGDEVATDFGELTNVAGTLYFAADDGVNGRELWRYIP